MQKIIIASSYQYLQDYLRYSVDISNKYAGTLDSANSDGATFSSETKHSNISSDASTSSFPSVLIPSVSNPANLGAASKSAITFNWSVPGLSTALKSSTAPAMSFSVPSFSIPSNTAISSSIHNSASEPQGFGSSAATPSTGDADDEDGEPIMEAEKVLRNEDDKDDIICDCNCKLHRYDTGKGDDGKGEWIDVGKGIFRVTKCTESGKQRMLVRNSVGKIIFNAAFYKGMKIDKKSKGMLSFGVVTDASGGLKTFLLKVKETDVAVVYSSMQSAIASF